MYMRFITLISAHRFEAIFCCRFGAPFSKDAEKFWCFVLKNILDFYVPTLKCGTLIPCDKVCEGTHPKILLYALDELFHVIRGVGQMTMKGNAWLPMRSCHLPHSILWSSEANP